MTTVLYRNDGDHAKIAACRLCLQGMTGNAKLALIKTIHTVIWVFFNLIIGYMIYAVAANKLDGWLWLCFGLVTVEGVVLVTFRWTCPLTLLARNYSSSRKDNFDIYLPNWLAKHTKLIYTTLAFVLLAAAVWRLLA
ncbi:hypothetical protein [Parapedobacter koreensis]|uniref:hypothetical protein n=1 Tax=Parapedobacter koreensis TaxID=332977 RepID=UPI001C433D07|nr:hypothetical protein [Parapedobacter koreensis]